MLWKGFDQSGTLFLGTSSSQQTQKTYRTLPFRTVEISSTDVSGSDGKAGKITPESQIDLCLFCCGREAV